MSFIAGCGGAAPEATASTDEAIQGGAIDKNDPAVGLVWIRGGGFCTGALIAPDVVLTAGHCVESAVAGFYTGAGKGTAEVGRLPAAGFVKHKVIDQTAHPSYQPVNQCPNPTYDVALLRLASPITTTPPLVVGTRAPRSGASCRAVGYGVHNSGQNSGSAVTIEQKRSATETVSAVARSAIHVSRKSGIVDHGDSGGPLLFGDAIAGVTSCGSGGGDPSHRDAWYGRTDELNQWIAETIAGWR